MTDATVRLLERPYTNVIVRYLVDEEEQAEAAQAIATVVSGTGVILVPGMFGLASWQGTGRSLLHSIR